MKRRRQIWGIRYWASRRHTWRWVTEAGHFVIRPRFLSYLRSQDARADADKLGEQCGWHAWDVYPIELPDPE